MSTAPQEVSMARPTLTEADLAHFHGTDTWYQHRLVRRVTYTLQRAL
jgi:hypothetical protein